MKEKELRSDILKERRRELLKRRNEFVSDIDCQLQVIEREILILTNKQITIDSSVVTKENI